MYERIIGKIKNDIDSLNLRMDNLEFLEKCKDVPARNQIIAKELILTTKAELSALERVLTFIKIITVEDESTVQALKDKN